MMRVTAIVLLAATLAHAGDGWERVGECDGIVVDERTTDGSPLRELRATAHSPVPPADVMATLWKHEDYPQFVPYVKRLDVLRDDGDTKLIYEQIGVPLAKDRDIVARLHRSVADGVYEVASAAVTDEGPPPRRDFVRVRTSHSHWRLAPAADGGTDVTYTAATDGGGLIPRWLLARIERDGTTKALRAMLERATRDHVSGRVRSER